MVCSELNHSDISADCLQVWGKPCEGGKMQATVHGRSTTGVSYACPICTWHIGDKVVSLWVNDCGNNNEIEVEICRDCGQRVGDISLKNTNKNFRTRRGGRTGNIDMQMKRDIFSITHKPLLRIDDDTIHKSSVDEMHARQGLMTYRTEELYLQLQSVELDEQNEFTDLLIKDIKKYIEETEKIKDSPEFKNKGAYFKKAKKEVEADYRQYTDAIANGLPCDEID